MALKLSNNATSTLASSITTGSTTISVQAGDAAKFPVLGAGDWFPVTVVDAAGNMEIMRCTARSGAALTVTRAQEGTTALAFAAGSRVDLRLTTAAVATKLSHEAETLTAAQQGQARANIGADVLGGFRNKLINGRFRINQRTAGNGTVAAGTSAFICDRWKLVNNTDQPLLWTIGSTHGYSRDEDENFVGIESVIAPTTGDFYIAQYVEDVRTFAGRKTTMFGRVLQGNIAGTQAYVIQRFGSGGSTAFGTGGAAFLTGTGLRSATLDVPSVAGKTIGTSSYLEVLFIHTPRVSGVLLVMTALGIVEGDATAEADPFSPRHLQQELALCQRYYEVGGGAVQFSGTVTDTITYYTSVQYKVTKRVAASVVLSNVGSNGFSSAVGSVNDSDVNGFYEARTANLTTPAGHFGSKYAADAEL